jgi:RNA methyltransferase, TrmH family
VRSANAWGPVGVVVVGTPEKPFHPKALRAAISALSHTPVCTADRAVLVAGVKRPVYLLAPDGVPMRSVELAHEAVIVLGSERHGVHSLWHDVTTARVAVPMTGMVDSLNVATSAAIVLWEAFMDRS